MYGFIYASKIQLGGRLQCIQSTSAVSGSSFNEKKQTLMKAAGATFKAPGLGKTSSSHGIKSLDRNLSELQLDTKSSSLPWEARGGDTLLSSEYVQGHAYSLANSIQ